MKEHRAAAVSLVIDAPNEKTCEMRAPGTLGVAIAITFKPTSGRNAAITADLATTVKKEVDPIIGALRAGGSR